jgi:hypothetical protein
MLQHANDAYVGRYDNPMVGTITIERRGDQLWATIGALSSVLEPFTQPETARVELVPMNGDVLKFEFGAEAHPQSVKLGDDVFLWSAAAKPPL